MENQLQELIQKVHDAHGGAEQLARVRAATIGGTWTLVDGRVYRYEMKLQLPDRLHWEFELEKGDQRVVNVLSGARAYVRENDVTRELTGKDHAALLDVHFRWSLAMMVGPIFPLCERIGFLGTQEFAGKQALALSLDAPGRRNLEAFFDPNSGEVLGYRSLTNLPKPGKVGHFSDDVIHLDAIAGEYRDLGGSRRMKNLRIVKNGHFDRLNDYLSLTLHSSPLPASLFEAP